MKNKLQLVLLSLFILISTNLFAQEVFMDADNTGNAYSRITSKLFNYEVPDCWHNVIHMTEGWDSSLNKNVFLFNLHWTNGIGGTDSPVNDNDRCINYDRQRTEMKVDGSSPAYMQGQYGDTHYYRWKFKIDSSFQTETSFTHVHQLKAGDGTVDTDNPLITISLIKSSKGIDSLQLRYISTIETGSVTIHLKDAVLAPFLGNWVEVYETVTYGNTGSYSVTIKKVSDETVLFTYTNNNIWLWRTGITYVRPKWGLYRSLIDSTHIRSETVKFADFALVEGTTSTTPAAPGSLSTSYLSGGKIKLTWTDNSTNEDQFRIDRSTDGTTWAYYTTTVKNSNTFTDSVSATNTYYYRVRSENVVGNSAFSNSSSYYYLAIEYYYSKSTGNLDVLTNWGSNTDGSGTSPSAFTTAGQKYVIKNRITATISATWTIANISTTSKIIVGDGINPCNFTVPSSYAVSGTIDVSANATLTWINASAPSLGTLNAVSIVNYNQSGAFTVPSVPLNYGNLILTGGTKIFSPVTYTVAGNLIFDGATNCNGGASPFTTLNLAGNFTLQNNAAFDTAQNNRMTLVCNGSSLQNLTGNGSEIILSRLTISNTAGVVLSNAAGSNITVGNLAGGGISFTTSGNFLNVNNNKVTFYAGKASIVGTGTFTAGINAEFVFNNISSSLNAMGTFSLTGGSQTIKNLTLNLASATAVDKVLILGSPVTITGILTLTVGYLTTSSVNLLTLGSSASISGGNASSYIDGPLALTVAASGSALFPIGKINPSNAYRPVTLTVTQGAGTNIYIVEQKEGADPGSSTLASTLNSKSSVRYVNIAQSGAASVSAASITMNYGTDDGVSANNAALRIAQDNGSVWVDLGGAGSAPTTGTIISAVNFTTFGDFILAFNAGRTLTLTALIEAMFVTSGTAMSMTPTVTIELHNATAPYVLVESKTATLNTAGVGTFTSTTAANGTPYFIVVKYLNSIEIWSATPQSFTSGELSYDFSTGVGQAYTDGSNPPLALHGDKYCIYSGDVNQDGFVTSDDFTGIDNDIAHNTFHLVNDVNGNGFITSDDFTFTDNNQSKGVRRQVPPGFFSANSIIRLLIINKHR